MDRIGTRATTSGLLTATGAETVHDTTVTISYTINGKAYSKAAITDGATPTTDTNTAAAITLVANYATIVVWALDSSGNVKCFQGNTVGWNGAQATGALQFPNVNLDSYCPFAYQTLKGGSTLSGTWTFGSSNWNATGLTSAIQNIHTLPPRPVSL